MPSLFAALMILAKSKRSEPLTVWRAAMVLVLLVSHHSALATETGSAAPTDDAVQEPYLQPSDQRSLPFLFGEDLLQENAFEICVRAGELAAEQRYQRLLHWVLPGNGQLIRIRGAFRRQPTTIGQTEIANANVQTLGDYPESTWLHSPARDLIVAAKELDRLDELRQRISDDPTTGDRQVDGRLALLTLIEIASGDVDAAAARLQDRFAHQRNTENGDTSSAQRWADLLVLWSAAENKVTSHLVTAELFGVYPELRYYHEDRELDLLNDYLRLLQGWSRESSGVTQRGLANDPTSEQHFDWFSPMVSFTHSRACPLTRFRITTGGARKISGHEFDYLAYRGPVTGDFEVSGVVSTQVGAFSDLMVHAAASHPAENGKHISIRGFAKSERDIVLDPPLEEIESQSHLRVTVRDGVATHFFNGRPVFKTSVEKAAAPWVALQSWRGTESEIHNFQIIGSPEIASSIDLLSPSLSGWASYYDPELNAGLGTWSVAARDEQALLLASDVPSGVSGSFREDLLRYVRPINWDATIQYEFKYQVGVDHVHPAFGRLVFLLTPSDVRLHRLTDGRDELSGLRSDNASPLDAKTARPPKLIEGWNQAKLSVEGDVLTLTVNDQLVAKWKLDPTDSRTFGLFRYRDQTQSLVRNVQLKGDWPEELPVIGEQLLASSVVKQLDDSAADLAVNFVHDFRNGFPCEMFDFDGDDTSIAIVPDGARMGRTIDEGVRAMRVCAIIEGDFDIVAGYEDLEISTGAPTWHCGVSLAINLENSTRDRCAISRRRDRMQGHHYVGFGQKETNAGGETTWIGGANLVDESTSGKLRLARRGNKVYGLHAVGDSPTFRVVKVTEVPPGKIAIHGLRFDIEVGDGLETSVTWSNLAIRADKIDFLTVDDQAASLAKLDKLREQKPSQIFDLTKMPLSEAGIAYRQMEQVDVSSDASGVTVTVQGDDSSQRFTMAKNVLLSSDFDVQVDFDVLQLDQGMREQASSEIVLQVRLDDATGLPADKEKTEIREATIILRHKWNGNIDLRPRIVGRGRGGKTIYLPIRTIPVKMPDQFRIVQHEQTLYFLYSETDSDQTQIIATYPLDRELIATSINLWTIASRDQKIVKSRWKKLQLHGTPATNNFLQFQPFRSSPF